MFTYRKSNYINSDEIFRQRLLYNLILGINKQPNSVLEKKMAVLLNHKSINPIIVEKLKRIDDLNDNLEEKLKTIKVSFDMKFKLHIPKIFKKQQSPEKLPFRSISNTNLQNNSLHKFETILFNNMGEEPYLDYYQFPSYLYLNTQYYLNKVPFINNDWRPLLLKLIELFNFDMYFTRMLFYQDRLIYKGNVYDIKIIPKFDINKLKPIYQIDLKPNHETIAYRNSLQITNNLKIDSNYKDIFKTFPFKDSHYIDNDGIAHYLDISYPKSKHTVFSIYNICNTNELESALTNIIQYENIEDLIALAVHSNDLQLQGIALLALNLKQGPILNVFNYKIRLPFMNDVLRWVKLSCNNKKIILPNINKELVCNVKLLRYVNFIKDIASNSTNRKEISFQCSSYIIPVHMYQSIINLLTTDLERYILLTFIIQQYPQYAYYRFYKLLNPEFNVTKTNIDLNQYNEFVKHTPIILNSIQISDELVEKNDDYYDCDIDNCFELYEPINNQLQELVKTGDTVLNYEQNLAFISLML